VVPFSCKSGAGVIPEKGEPAVRLNRIGLGALLPPWRTKVETTVPTISEEERLVALVAERQRELAEANAAERAILAVRPTT